jgi:chorismate mutase
MVATATKGSTGVDLVAAAREEVARLRRAELELSERRMGLAADLGSLEQEAGAATLDTHLGGTGTAAETIQRLVKARAELDALDAAITEARSRRREAIPAAWQAQATQLRQRAAQLLAEVAERQPKTDKLLAELAAWEHCAYAPTQALQAPLNGEQLGGAPFVRFISTPRTVLLQTEAAQLEQQAVATERQTITDRGAVLGRSATELIEQLRQWDPMRMGLALPAAAAWAERAVAALQARLARLQVQPHHPGYGSPPFLDLIWAGDDIDESRSRAASPALDN